MPLYNFEYFCGANVVVAVEGLPLLEAAGLQYEMADSKMPLYGYSSRHYDAVAAGQVIVRGQLVVNFVHNDYLFRAIQLQNQGVPTDETPVITIPGAPVDVEVVARSIGSAGGAMEAQMQQARDMYWRSQEVPPKTSRFLDARNPHDIIGGVDITATFGQQGSFAPGGKTSVLLRDVHFTGRSNVIRIDEEVVVEVYPFFARNALSLRSVY